MQTSTISRSRPTRAHGAAADPGDRSGQRIGARYRLVRRLGERVTLYQGRRLSLGEPMLIRVLPGSANGPALQRFLREARAAATLHHGHIVRVLDFGVDMTAEAGPIAYVAMECLHGENLTTTLAKHGPLHWTRVLAIARQICRALIVAHDRGIVHGDVGPARCFRVAGRSSPDFIKLLDFAGTGAVGQGGPPLTRPADDLQALGVLMLRLLTGASPVSPQCSQALVPALDVPPALAAVLLAALADDPRWRPADARALHRALVAAEPAPSRPPR